MALDVRWIPMLAKSSDKFVDAAMCGRVPEAP